MVSDLRATQISLFIHIIVGIVAGWLSSTAGNALLIAAEGLILLFATGYATQYIVKKKGIKWWFANGIWVYLFLWFIAWTVFINL